MLPTRIPIVSVSPSVFQNTYSLDFDGTNDVLQTSNSFESVFKDSFTISAWIKLDDGQISTNQVIFGTQSYSNYSGYIWLRVVASNGQLSFKHGTLTSPAAENNEFTVSASTSPFADGASAWTHIVATLSKASATSGTMTVYKNASSIGTSSSPGSGWNLDNYANTYNAYIGASNITGTASLFLGGLIDEVSIFNTVLDSNDVTAIYNSGVPNDLTKATSYNTDRTSNLQGWWRFEEGSGTSATDSSTNSNTGTLTNGPAYSTDVPS